MVKFENYMQKALSNDVFMSVIAHLTVSYLQNKSGPNVVNSGLVME